MYTDSVWYNKLREHQGSCRCRLKRPNCPVLLRLYHYYITLYHYYSNYFLIIAIILKNYSVIAKQKMAICVGIHCRNRGRWASKASPPQSAFAEFRVAGFAAGRAAREASFNSGSLWVCASTRRWQPAWARNNPSNCNKNLFEHVHTSISGIFRLHGSWMVYDLLSFLRSPPLLEAWNGGLNTKAPWYENSAQKQPQNYSANLLQGNVH